jgi:hypothetical protein
LEGLLRFRRAQDLWLRLCPPLLPLVLIKMIRDEGGFLKATAQVRSNWAIEKTL